MIYDRQKELPLQIPHSATVIGVGGVGSWVALDLALVGVKKLVLVDPDTVEDTNLNRTPFKLSQIGEPKVQALMELVLERRDNIEIIPLQKWVEKLSVTEKKQVKNTNVVIDCKDNSLPIEGIKTPITGGYDGKQITLFISPDPKKIWGDEPVTYRTIPSYVVPPQFLASLIVNYIVSGLNIPENYISINIDDIYEILINHDKKYHEQKVLEVKTNGKANSNT